MQVVSSDTLVIETTPAAGQPAGTMTVSGQFGGNAGLAMATSGVIVFGVGNPAKHPTASPAFFEAHDTVLDWVGLSKKLESFRALPKGWDGYNAAPPGEKPLEFATAFLDLLRQHRYLPSRLAPSVVGGVGMTFRKAGRKVYVEFSNKGTVHALFSDALTEPVVQKVVPDLAGYRALIAKARAYLHE